MSSYNLESIPAVKWGLHHEEKAKAQFEHGTGVSVSLTGNTCKFTYMPLVYIFKDTIFMAI